MPIVRHVDLPLLYQLWNDHTLTRVKVSAMLGISPTHLTRLVARHKLPPRPRDRNQKTVDPTPEEIERDKAALKAKHMAERRGESEEKTRQFRIGGVA
jgi:hypothetical protein